MNNRNKIDDLFREAMTGYRVEPSFGLWRRIERRIFPPSNFRPSGLITSILLLTVAGLMPWILIPANDRDEKEPNLPAGNAREGYLIQSASPELVPHDRLNDHNLNGKTYSIKPTVYLEKPVSPAGEASTEFIASINDPSEDPAIRPILSANQKNFVIPSESGTEQISRVTENWLYRMNSRTAGLSYTGNPAENIGYRPGTAPSSAFTSGYENAYFKNAEFSAGLNFSPSIVFYDPNPYNQMLGAEAVVQCKISSFNLMTGVGISRMEDIGSYRVNYITNDSVGYYLRVVSFIPDPRNPGQINYILAEEAIYDSVVHYAMEDKTNYYTYLDIPLSFGYTFLQKNRVSLTASVGIKFSVLLDSREPKADFWMPEAELVNIERQIPARMNTNWRFTAGVDFGYLFTRKFSLHLEPVFEQYISPIYVSEPGYKPKKPCVTGVKAGVRYNF